MNLNSKKCKAYIETYGCSANRSGSEIMAGILEKNGMEIIDSPDPADIIILNTCIVKKPTETKIIYRIKQLNDSGKKLIVAGCMPEIRQREISKIAPNASVVSTHQLTKIAEAADRLINGGKAYFVGNSKEENICLPRKRSNPMVAIIEISKGCLGNCAYCSVKEVKGNLHSYSQKSIIQEIQDAVSEGCKEIWLTSQDCGCYGTEKGETIIDLLKKIEEMPGDFRIRIGMMNPEHILPILDGLIQCYENERVYKFLHIPIQSGSDPVLERMNRGYRVDAFRKIISKFRNKIPEMNIWTDIIVGFPGESDKEFESTMGFIENTNIDAVNVNKFGAMKGTRAAEMEQVDGAIIKERARKASIISRNILVEANKLQIGKKKKILVTEKGREGTLKGKDESFRQVVLKSSRAKLGDFIEGKIFSASVSGLTAE